MAAGADPSQADFEGRTPFLSVSLNEELRSLFMRTTWASIEERLPLISPDSQVYDLIWDERVSSPEGRRRQNLLVDNCILPLLRKLSQQVLSSEEKDSLRHALVATKCPLFRCDDLEDDKSHNRGDAFDEMLETCMTSFEARFLLRENQNTC